jgi:predicted RNase H-like HicB family nuclease
MAKKSESKKPVKYIVTDGDLVLELEKEGKWYCVTSPFNPEIITQARTVEEAFEMARDVIETYGEYRKEQQVSASESAKPVKNSKKTA